MSEAPSAEAAAAASRDAPPTSPHGLAGAGEAASSVGAGEGGEPDPPHQPPCSLTARAWPGLLRSKSR